MRKTKKTKTKNITKTKSQQSQHEEGNRKLIVIESNYPYPSLNEFGKNKKPEVLFEINKLLQSRKPLLIEEFYVVLEYNYRFDVDNTITIVKLFVDALRYNYYIATDSNKVFKAVKLIYKPDLDYGTWKLSVIGKSPSKQRILWMLKDCAGARSVSDREVKE